MAKCMTSIDRYIKCYPYLIYSGRVVLLPPWSVNGKMGLNGIMVVDFLEIPLQGIDEIWNCHIKHIPEGMKFCTQMKLI